MWELEAKDNPETFACESGIKFPSFFVFCSTLRVDLITEKKICSHRNQLFEFFPCSYALLQKNKKLPENLGYIFVFLQKWIVSREKFEKWISVEAFFFLDEQKTKKKQNVMADSHAKVSGLIFASSSHNLKKTFWNF